MKTKADETSSVFAGKAILIVEDEYLVASMIMDAFEDAGAEIVGPVSDMGVAFDMLDNPGIRVDAVTLDIKLGGVDVFPLAERLRDDKIPFVFLTGYECHFLPEPFRGSPCLSKPFGPEEVLDVLAPFMAAKAPA